MKVMVTGGAGYIGSLLLKELLDTGFKVVCLDRFYFGFEPVNQYKNNPNFEIVKKDIRDLTKEDFKEIEIVMDLAALSNDPAGEINPDITMAINFKGRAKVARLAKASGVRRYILSSSCSVYGDTSGASAKEDYEVNPLTTYATANHMAEEAVLRLNDTKFCVTVLRLATVFGLSYRMRFDLVVNVMTLNAIQTGKVNILGGGNQWRPLIHVKDVAFAFINVAQSKSSLVAGERFNVGSNNQNFTVRALAYIVRENLPFAVEIVDTPTDLDKRNYRIEFTKINTVLAFQCKYSPSDAIKEIYEAIKLNEVDTGLRTRTVEWYKHIINSKRLLNEIELKGRLLK